MSFVTSSWRAPLAAKPVLQASDTLLGLGKDDANDVRSLFRADIRGLLKSFQFLDVLF